MAVAVSILTPEGKVFEGDVYSVSAPGALGSFGVLEGHAPMIAALGTGVLPWWAIFGAMIVAGLMRGVYNPSRDVLVRRAAPDGRVGTAFGFVTLGYTVGQGGTPVPCRRWR